MTTEKGLHIAHPDIPPGYSPYPRAPGPTPKKKKMDINSSKAGGPPRDTHNKKNRKRVLKCGRISRWGQKRQVVLSRAEERVWMDL